MKRIGRTRYYFDTEFHEDGRIIDLISIGMVCGDSGETYYAVSNEFDPAVCCEFVHKEVLPKLVDGPEPRSRAKIREEIESFVKRTSLDFGNKPEFWAYFADYDWVVFCQLFGSMMKLPKDYPHFCRDLVQVLDERNIPKNCLPAQIGAAHDALSDAIWVRDAHEFIEEHDLRGVSR